MSVELELPDDAGRAGLQARGYRPEREVLRMVGSLSEPLSLPARPAGVGIRTWREGDGRRVHAVLVEAYATGRELVPPYEEWLPWLTGDAEFDPALCFLAEAGGELAGVCQCWTSAFVKDLAVLPSFRGRGIGEALLRTAFAELRSRGATTVALGVDAENPTGAIRLYERLGMRVERRLELWTSEAS